jgi:hypothetical protein
MLQLPPLLQFDMYVHNHTLPNKIRNNPDLPEMLTQNSTFATKLIREGGSDWQNFYVWANRKAGSPPGLGVAKGALLRSFGYVPPAVPI